MGSIKSPARVAPGGKPRCRGSWRGSAPSVTRMCAPAVFLLRLLRTGKLGRPSTCPLFNAPPQPSKAAMALWRHSITISEACRSGAPRGGRFSITSMAVPQMARRPQRGFSGGSFLTFLKQCYRKAMPCPGLENAIGPWRQLVDVMRCPALRGYPCHGRRPRLPPRCCTPQARHCDQGQPGGRTREEKRPNRLTIPCDAMLTRLSSFHLLAMASLHWMLVGSY
jgi:hypothetical protein